MIVPVIQIYSVVAFLFFLYAIRSEGKPLISFNSEEWTLIIISCFAWPIILPAVLFLYLIDFIFKEKSFKEFMLGDLKKKKSDPIDISPSRGRDLYSRRVERYNTILANQDLAQVLERSMVNIPLSTRIPVPHEEKNNIHIICIVDKDMVETSN